MRRKRTRIAFLLALAALAAAVVGALGPAERVRTQYEWPPTAVASKSPEHAWYTPLLLARYRPERISAEIPCSPPPSLAEANGATTTVLGTARTPERTGGLHVVRNDDGLLVTVKRDVLARLNVPETITEGCGYALTIEARRWSISGPTASHERSGTLAKMPVVSGLFSDLDLTKEPRPRIEVTTAVHATRPTSFQSSAWLLAAGATVASLVLLVIAAPRRPRRRRLGPAAWWRLHPADAVVAVLLLAWWILSPAFFDDGWVVARQREFSGSGGFSTYYDSLAINLPNGYWLEWAQHLLIESSSALLVLRIPSLVCLAAVWIVCRWVHARLLADDDERHSAWIWPMAAAFLAGAMAWGMTLRPEPMTALLTTGMLACAIAFRRSPSVVPLALAAALVPLALTSHHAGVVSIAPLIVIAPAIRRWARGEKFAAATVILAGSALLLVLFSLGADVAQRLTDAADTQRYSTGVDAWYDELRRYSALNVSIYATPLRRAFVVLMGLVLAAYLLRRPRSRQGIDIPALTLLVSLLLLVITPSKHPWHFGALIGVLAVAASCEAVRVGRTAASAKKLELVPFLLVGGLFVGAGWAWSTRGPWNAFDLRTLDWRPAFEDLLSLALLAAVLPIAVLFGVAYAGLLRHGPRALVAAPWRAASWMTPVLVVPAITFTLVTLAADAARADSWTLSRQNLETLRGRVGCGLGDELRVRGPTDPPEGVPVASLMATSRVLVVPDMLLYFPCTRLPHLRGGVVEPPDHIVAPQSRKFLLNYVTSPFLELSDLYRATPLELVGPNAPKRLDVLAVDQEIPGATELAPVQREISSLDAARDDQGPARE